jgi:hypothetical protein
VTDSENIDRVVVAIMTVPEKKLRIIAFVNSIPIVNGGLDYKILSEKAPEINLIITEAKVYGAHTMQAVESLLTVRAREEG